MPNVNGAATVVQARGAGSAAGTVPLRFHAMRGAVSPKLAIAIAVVVIAAVVAWFLLGRSGGGPEATAPQRNAAAPAVGAAATATEGAAQADLTVDQLYGEARKAMADNRMVAPRIDIDAPSRSSARDAARPCCACGPRGADHGAPWLP